MSGPVLGTGPEFWIEFFRRRKRPRRKWWKFWQSLFTRR